MLDFAHTLREQNSCRFNSQKENRMQMIKLVNTTKNELPKDELIDEIYAPALSEKSDKVKVQEANILSLQRTKSMSRMLEANSDCV